jgi:hypothetical protein
MYLPRPGGVNPPAPLFFAVGIKLMVSDKRATVAEIIGPNLEEVADRGLLEQAVLFIGPGNGSGERVLLAGDRATPVGLARWITRRKWGPFCASPILNICEQEDQPLLFTISPCWSFLSKHVIHDAEGRRIGFVRRDRLLDYSGFRWAEFLGESNEGDGCFWGNGQQCLAQMSAHDSQLRMMVNPSLTADPFSKMLLVAGALWQYEKLVRRQIGEDGTE